MGYDFNVIFNQKVFGAQQHNHSHETLRIGPYDVSYSSYMTILHFAFPYVQRVKNRKANYAENLA